MENLFNLSKIFIVILVLNIIFAIKVEAFGEIQISEINYIGYTIWEDSEESKSGDEFIEIYNNTEQEINLQDYKLRVLSGSSDTTIILNGEIKAKDYLVIRKVTESQKNTLLPIEKVLFYSDIARLHNERGAFIELRDNNNITIDSVNFYGKWPVVTEKGDSLHRLENNTWESKQISLLQKEYLEESIPEEIEIIDIEEEVEEVVEEEIKEDIIINYDNKLRISEFLPDQVTKFESEFVEIENLTDEDIDLTGWKIDDILDGGSNPKNLTGIIPAKSLFSIKVSMLNNYNSNITLFDEVNLISPDTKVQDSQKYLLKDVKKEFSYALINGKYEWTNQPTENLPNKSSLIIEVPKVEDKLLEEDLEEEIVDNTQNIESGWIYFTEFVANPGSGTANEFIEIYNSTNQVIKLDGWKLGDLSKTITLSGEIQPYSYRVFGNKDTKITLNNSGETVKLIKPDGQVYQEIIIPKSESNQSYSKFEDKWSFTTTITEGKDNILTEPEKVETKQAKTKTSVSRSKSTEAETTNYRNINFSDIDNLNHNEDIEITGTVFIELDKIYKNSFYITNGQNVLRVTIPNNSDYQINLNQNLILQGTFHKTKTQMYLKLKEIAGIESKNFNPKFEMQDNLSKSKAFVQISGVLNTNTATKLIILPDNQKQATTVKISENAFRKPAMRKGDRILVQGFVEEYDGELRLVPYREQHISVETEEEMGTEKSTKSNSNIVQASSINSSNQSNLVSKYVPWEEYATENSDLLQDSGFAKWLEKIFQSGLNFIPKELKENQFFILVFLTNIIWWIFSSFKVRKH